MMSSLTRSRLLIVVTLFTLVAGGALLLSNLRKSSTGGTSGTDPIVKPEATKMVDPNPNVLAAGDSAVAKPSVATMEQGEKKVSDALRGLFNLSSNNPLTQQEVRELFKTLLDNKTAFADRRKAAWRLARSADNGICDRLKTFLMDPTQDSALKALISEGLGNSKAQQAEGLILYQLEHGGVTEACGAVRGLAARGTDKETARLEQLLSLSGVEGSVRGEVLSALGIIRTPRAYSILTNLYAQAGAADDSALQATLIKSLSQKDISQTSDFFGRVLSDPATNPEVRKAVATAVGAAEGETAPVLVNLLSDSDAEVRAEAAWGLVAMDQSKETVFAVSKALGVETDPMVRKYLYETLALQDAKANRISAETANRIFHEESTGTRVSGYLLLAKQMQGTGDEGLRQRFDEQAVPELTRIAVSGKTASERIQAVKVLDRAGTETAKTALLNVISSSGDPRVINASGIDLGKLMNGMK